MITLVYEAKTPSPLFENQMREISGTPEVQCICVEDIDLAKAFNKSIKKAHHDIVVFLRKGVSIHSENWARIIINTFSTTSYGILGTLGTLIVPKSGMLWEKEEPLCGCIWYEEYHDANKNLFGEEFTDKVLDVVSLEGSFMAIHKDRLAVKFDQTYKGDSFYDSDFCIENYIAGVKVGVVFGIDVLKAAFDDQDDNFVSNHIKFIDKHKELPCRINPKVVIDQPLVEIKETPSLNIVIPNKGKAKELITCLSSILEKSSYENYLITIMDYGSSDAEKVEIMSFITSHENIEFIQTKQPQVSQIYNDAVNTVNSDLVLFLSKHTVLVNDAISLMVSTYLKNPNKCGTVGLRSHQNNHMVRQFGLQLISFETEEGMELGLDLKGFGKAYAYRNELVEGVMGNPSECFLVERELFLQLGGFNVNYMHSLEDFEFNLKVILSGRKNFLVGNAVAYYGGFDRPKYLPKDYLLLMDFINENIEHISPYVNLMSA